MKLSSSVFRFVIFPFAAILLLAACENRVRPKKPSPAGFTDESFTSRLQALFREPDSANGKKVKPVTEAVRYTYFSDDYQPIWIKANYSSNDFAGKLIAELEDLQWDGLATGRYEIEALKKLKLKLDTTRHNSLDDAITFDTLMTRSYLLAAHDLLVGSINPKSVDSLWFHVNDSAWNAPALLAEPHNVYPTLDSFRSRVPTYELLREEYRRIMALKADTVFDSLRNRALGARPGSEGVLKKINPLIHTVMPWVKTIPNDSVSPEKQLLLAYQCYAGIPRTGVADSCTLACIKLPPDSLLVKIRANMERVRWMQRRFGSVFLVVDVPLAELFLKRGDSIVQHMRVVVGKPERQTPSLYATMANVVINPPWGVPPTILKNDVLPGLEKSGKKYLTKKGLKAYDNDGNEVPQSKLNSRNYKNYTYKQDPGDDNALGYVKFNLPNPWDIYLHDTPHRGDFGKRFRALSSGCIRLQKPLDLAIYILSELDKKRYTQGRLDTIISTHKTRWEGLRTHIPVHIAYLTAYEDTTGLHIQFARDIYDRDQKLIASLQKMDVKGK